MNETKRNRKFEGVVVSAKMDSTVKVSVEYKIRHPRYQKVLTRKKTYLAHADDKLNEGDKVTIMETKPYSKKVTWIVVK